MSGTKGIALAALMLVGLACGVGETLNDTTQEIAQSQVKRETSPDVSQPSLSQLAAGNTAFAFDFYQALREDDGNLFFSPFSISAALGA
jgi:serine protease inhibitor